MTAPMRAAEIAEALGITPDTFYRRRRALEETDGMPQPICSIGRLAWDRASMQAWLRRNDPLRPKPPANDVTAPSPATTIEEHRAELHAYYSGFQHVHGGGR
jgi:predicted DNA-binding transcriptional regulator AlpA